MTSLFSVSSTCAFYNQVFLLTWSLSSDSSFETLFLSCVAVSAAWVFFSIILFFSSSFPRSSSTCWVQENVRKRFTDVSFFFSRLLGVSAAAVIDPVMDLFAVMAPPFLFSLSGAAIEVVKKRRRRRIACQKATAEGKAKKKRGGTISGAYIVARCNFKSPYMAKKNYVLIAGIIKCSLAHRVKSSIQMCFKDWFLIVDHLATLQRPPCKGRPYGALRTVLRALQLCHDPSNYYRAANEGSGGSFQSNISCCRLPMKKTGKRKEKKSTFCVHFRRCLVVGRREGPPLI